MHVWGANMLSSRQGPKSMSMPKRESTVSESLPSLSEDDTSTIHGYDYGEANAVADHVKPSRKRKRKGLGNWTRTTLACVRCRKMKIRVVPSVPACSSRALTAQCDDARPCGNCKRWSYECVTTQTEASQAKIKSARPPSRHCFRLIPLR